MSDTVETIFVLMFDDPKHGESISNTKVGFGPPVADVFSAKVFGGMTVEKKLEQMRYFGRLHAADTGRKYRIVKFTRSVVVEEITR